MLVSEPPARAEVAPTGPYATTAQLGDLELNLVVDPAAAGRNQIHLYLTNPAGQPTDVDEASVSATLASREIGPLRLDGAPRRPRPFRRPRRPARARGRLAAPRRDSPRRVRRRARQPSPSRSERNPTDEEDPDPARGRAHSSLVPAASAHVTVNPNEVPADSFSRFAIRVPTERPNADTTKVVAAAAEGPVLRQLPAQAGLDADDRRWRSSTRPSTSSVRRIPSGSPPSPGRAARSPRASSTSSG